MQTNKMTCQSNKGLEMFGRPFSLGDPEKGGWVGEGDPDFFLVMTIFHRGSYRPPLRSNWILGPIAS